jgi:hypothetical protein
LFRSKDRTKQKAVNSPNPVPKRAEQNQLDRSGEWQEKSPLKNMRSLTSAGHAVLDASRTVDSRPPVSPFPGGFFLFVICDSRLFADRFVIRGADCRKVRGVPQMGDFGGY